MHHRHSAHPHPRFTLSVFASRLIFRVRLEKYQKYQQVIKMRRDQIALSNILEESEDLAASQDLSDFIENENLIKRKLRGAQRKPTPRVVSNGRRTPNLLELVSFFIFE